MNRNIVLAGMVIVVGAGVLYAYRSHQKSPGGSDDTPVVAPSRLVEAGGEVRVSLDSAGARLASLQLAALRNASVADAIELRGEIAADPDAITVIRAPVSGRLAASEGRTWPVYGDRLATGEAIAVVSDARPLTVPRGGTVTRVLARPGAIVQAGDPLLELTDFSRPVVRVAWTSDAPASPPEAVTVRQGNAAPGYRATFLGAAAEADPVTRSPAYLYRLDGSWGAARPGVLVTVSVPSGKGPVRGVLIPSSAVVQWDGLEWAWLRRGVASYVRIRVPTDRPVAGGWLAGAPWQAGDSVVITGAEQLLSEEFRARVTVGDEVAE
ncbi:MAG TPA: HlyD family efflux transporter periplasmic adaptor subunit [Gemmatimonadales bacterium]|nr:HlyD family efflux transporter periplasmic adaptor subunit [Gemmatimonadales bacterium]